MLTAGTGEQKGRDINCRDLAQPSAQAVVPLLTWERLEKQVSWMCGVHIWGSGRAERRSGMQALGAGRGGGSSTGSGGALRQGEPRELLQGGRSGCQC